MYLKWLKLGLHFNYTLSHAAYYLRDHGDWLLKCHVLIVGPLGFAVLWKTPRVPADTDDCSGYCSLNP